VTRFRSRSRLAISDEEDGEKERDRREHRDVTSAVRAVSLASDSLDTVHSRLHDRKEVEEVARRKKGRRERGSPCAASAVALSRSCAIAATCRENALRTVTSGS